MAKRFTTISNPFRVQIPAYTDRWMMGDRYGEAVASRLVKRTADADYPQEQLRVKLDKSGRTVIVIADDCTPV